MYKTHFLSNDPLKIQHYKIYANKLNKLKTTSKIRYYADQFTRCKNNLKATWKLIGTLIKRKTKGQSYPCKLIRNDTTYYDKKDIANQFNEHIVNVGPSLANSIVKTNKQPLEYMNPSPASSFVMETQVYHLLSSLDARKSSTHIPNHMIKISATIIAPIITQLYNDSITQGIVPDILKIARVTPIFKSGLDTDPYNYRPISTLSPFSKVLEKLVHEQLERFLEKHLILLVVCYSKN